MGVFASPEHPNTSQQFPSDTAFHVLLVFFTAIFSLVCVILQRGMSQCMSMPVLTMPFNIAALWFLSGSFAYKYVTITKQSPHLIDPKALEKSITFSQYLNDQSSGDAVLNILQVVFRGVSQVYFCPYYPTGVIMFFAFAICDLYAAMHAVLGSSVGAATGAMLGVVSSKDQPVVDGLLGFNAVLCCIAIGGIFVKQTWMSTGAAILCAMISVCLWGALMNFTGTLGMPSLTVPFCISVFTFLSGMRWVNGPLVPKAQTVQQEDEEIGGP